MGPEFMSEKSLCCRIGIGTCGMSLEGDMDMVRGPGDGDERAEPVSE